MNMTQKPRIFYRGTNPGDTRRITTGNARWDSRLFCASDPDRARDYGSSLERIEAHPNARILYEGTAEFRRVARGIRGANLLDLSDAVTAAAEQAGYDAVWFRLQGSIGTVIMNRDMFVRGLFHEHSTDPEPDQEETEDLAQQFRL
jgi:hypothetical protein